MQLDRRSLLKAGTLGLGALAAPGNAAGLLWRAASPTMSRAASRGSAR